MRRLRSLGVLIGAAGLLAAACGTSSIIGNRRIPSGPAGVLTISNESGVTVDLRVQPVQLDSAASSFGPVYEPLDVRRRAAERQDHAVAGHRLRWSNGNKTLTFTIRNGVKWTDGKPFTAADVVFTFNLLKKYPALDLNSDLVGAVQRRPSRAATRSS